MLYHRHRRFVRDTLNQSLAATRYEHVDMLVHRRQQADNRAIGGRDQLHRVFRQPGNGEPFPNAGRDGLIRMQRFRAAAQDAGVSRLETKGGGVGGDVGPRFVDDADDAEWHPHVPDLDAARPELKLADFADGIGQGGDFAHAFGHCRDARCVESEPIDERRIAARAARRRDVLRVGGQQAFLVANDCQGDRLQRGILCRRRRASQEARCRTCALADLAHVRGQIQTGDVEVGHAGYSIPIGAHTGDRGPVERTTDEACNGAIRTCARRAS